MIMDHRLPWRGTANDPYCGKTDVLLLPFYEERKSQSSLGLGTLGLYTAHTIFLCNKTLEQN